MTNSNIKNEVDKSLKYLISGGILIYPTDTIWGIGGDATNEKVVEQIYKIKQRNDSKSMLILVDKIDRLYKYFKEIPDIAFDLFEQAIKPLSIVLPNAINLPKNLLAEDGSLGVRIVKDDFCNSLIFRFQKPIISSSANISGEKSPTQFSDISDSLKENVDYIVNHKRNELSKYSASGIIKIFENGTFKIIRE